MIEVLVCDKCLITLDEDEYYNSSEARSAHIVPDDRYPRHRRLCGYATWMTLHDWVVCCALEWKMVDHPAPPDPTVQVEAHNADHRRSIA